MMNSRRPLRVPFPTRCARCLQEIPVGTLATFVPQEGIHHEECANTKTTVLRDAEVNDESPSR